MAELRWILLIIGVLVLVGIYVFGLRNRKTHQHYSRLHKRRSSPVLKGRGVDAVPEIGAELEEALIEELEALQLNPKRKAPTIGDDASVNASDDDRPEPVIKGLNASGTENRKSAPAQQIIVMHVVPEDDKTLYTGKQIVAAMKKTGLFYGKMKIFQRVVEVDGKKQPIFGVANMVEPGVFEASELEKLRSPGLTLFLQLPGPIRGVDAFDRMVSDANALKKELSGVVLNDKREPMDQAWVDILRVKLISEAA